MLLCESRALSQKRVDPDSSRARQRQWRDTRGVGGRCGCALPTSAPPGFAGLGVWGVWFRLAAAAFAPLAGGGWPGEVGRGETRKPRNPANTSSSATLTAPLRPEA